MEETVRQRCLDLLRQTIDRTQEAIDTCQKFADKCSTLDREECAKQTGLCRNRCFALLQTCKDTMEASYDYMSHLDDPVLLDSLDNAVLACSEALQACNGSLVACNKDVKTCNDVTLNSLEIWNKCAKQCAQTIDALTPLLS